MARSQPGESKAPLVIALAFFVLTTLALGVLTYLAYDDMGKLKEAAKAAADKQSAAEKAMAAEEEKKLLYKGTLGLLTPDEQAKIQNLRQKDAVRTEYNDLQGAIERRVRAVVDTKTNEIRSKDPRAAAFQLPITEVFDWNWSADGNLPPQPRTPLADQVVAFYAAQKLSNIEVQQKTARMDEAMKAAADRARNADAIAAQYKKKLDDLPGEIAAIAKKHDDDLAKVRKNYEDEVKKYNEDRRNWEEAKNTLELRLRQSGDDYTKLHNRTKALEASEEAREDPFAHDQPHGKVLRINRRNDIIEIDLGSADNVKPGLKFSVQPSDTPQKGFSTRRARDGSILAKAKIEVIQALGPHLSQARIIEQRDEIRDGVLPGDLLYNSVWRKGEPDHVALFGIFDLTGDGTDDIKQLTRDLTRMGIVVDAYYDLAQKKWVGKLTEKTIYAIQGNTPFKVISAGEPPAVVAAKGEILNAIQDAQKDAKDRGTKVVRMRDFFPRIGYPVNLDVDERRIDQAASRYLKADTATPPAEGSPTEPKN